jgi:hypothetical protein
VALVFISVIGALMLTAAVIIAAIAWLESRSRRRFDRHVSVALDILRHPSMRGCACGAARTDVPWVHTPTGCQPAHDAL